MRPGRQPIGNDAGIAAVAVMPCWC